MYVIEIRKHENDEVIHRSTSLESRHRAEKCEDGYNINLNHEDYYTEIVEENEK